MHSSSICYKTGEGESEYQYKIKHRQYNKALTLRAILLHECEKNWKETAKCRTHGCTSNITAALCNLQSSSLTAKHISLLPFNNLAQLKLICDITRTDDSRSMNTKTSYWLFTSIYK